MDGTRKETRGEGESESVAEMLVMVRVEMTSWAIICQSSPKCLHIKCAPFILSIIAQ